MVPLARREVIGAWLATSGCGEGVRVLVGGGYPAGFVDVEVVAEVGEAPVVTEVWSLRAEEDSGDGERWLERGRRCGVKVSVTGILVGFVLSVSEGWMREPSSQLPIRIYEGMYLSEHFKKEPPIHCRGHKWPTEATLAPVCMLSADDPGGENSGRRQRQNLPEKKRWQVIRRGKELVSGNGENIFFIE
ncbi:hypothetical protein GUJ93_ZPchr0006g41365 [Zizania palustris]|uniref:Uncharacterized protein n=1 Tax=Zizania palustris TaxID=103762 RepID=A0A8J5TGS3_ZIZPA|nr:hypothetical protein GUJ93_ZPchr0006g41365 [Zizania palustris]